MINTILAVDTNDEELGDFFKECSDDLVDYYLSKEEEIKVLQSASLNELSLKTILEKIQKFIFLAYSHGSDDELLVGANIPYINYVNAGDFCDSFFYTCSCHTGKILGGVLIENGCLSYIGYKGKFSIWDFNRPPFIECANYGAKLFIAGEESEKIVPMMVEKYNEHIDNYENDIFGAAFLLSNRKALTHLGKNTSIADL